MIRYCWFPNGPTVCRTSEYEIRNEAFHVCQEEGFGIKAALWSTIANQEHRMVHWLQLISIANSRSGGGDYAALERKLNDLQREGRGRSRSPRRQGGNRRPKALPAPPQRLALTDGPNRKSTGKGQAKADEIRKKVPGERQQHMFSVSTTPLRQRQQVRTPPHLYRLWWEQTLRRLPLPQFAVQLIRGTGA